MLHSKSKLPSCHGFECSTMAGGMALSALNTASLCITCCHSSQRGRMPANFVSDNYRRQQRPDEAVRQWQEASILWSWSSARSTQHTHLLPDFLQASSIPMCMTTERHGGASQLSSSSYLLSRAFDLPPCTLRLTEPKLRRKCGQIFRGAKELLYAVQVCLSIINPEKG